ncbi:Lysophosphatidic acid:oleoyl-CoA acyltransferase 1 [Mucor velutinosus]|uniref:Lysophosphatidic acid:oleoyl-CoA acyltransferase 1 n=1 Tax=Mucor velutinosus TaxID=708070 RepID=A0AAN7DPL6_9FUNG|nr:Lysophosphatidic acid:oleoyl-CoA acyltransferase 1 [Mucor velutinosus]
MDDTKPSSLSSSSSPSQKDKQQDINSLPHEAMSLNSNSSNEHFSAADFPEQPNVETNQPLTAELLAEQNELYSNKLEPKPNAIRAWAADLPEVPDSVQPILTTTHIFEMESLTLDDEEEEEAEDETVRQDHQPKIQETKDVFSETQKVAYVSLCYLTSLEVVYDFQGKDFTYARMSADNWQRKLMRMLYCHMDISADEIKMIESLSKHDIRPTDLVHQFTSQGQTAEVQLDDLNTKPSQKQAAEFDNNKIIIDLCWTVMCDLFLICLSTENYDARSRVFVARIASYLSLDWFQVIGFEKRIAEHLLEDANWETETVTSVATTMTTMTMTNVDHNGLVQNDVEKKSRNKQRKKRRYVMIGLATIGGGLILGLSAGLMAPVIAGGLGALLTTVGVGGTGFLGSTAGIALITGGATLAGGRIGGKSMNKRMKTINTFEFLPVHVDENVNCIISITGWLPSKDADEASLPFSTLDPLMGDHYNLYYEPEMLFELGSAFRIFATEAVTFSIQQALAHTIMGALLAGLAFPLALTKLGYIVDNPWANALDRSRLAGLILADTLMNRNLGARPITLVGYSLGARVIFFCLLELARVKAFGLVENVALFGTPVSGTKAEWKECTTIVSGRFVNGYATNDWLLGFLFRTSTAGLGNIAGLRPLSHIEGNRVQNLDCTDLVTGHLSYRSSMPKLLKRAGFVVTSEELPVKEKDKTSLEEDTSSTVATAAGASSDIKNKHLDSASSSLKKRSSLSSLSSGKASIQLSSKTSTPIAGADGHDHESDAMPTRTASSSTAPMTPGNQSPRTSNDNKLNGPNTMSDYDIIADIIANATAAASSKSGTYSSLSSGKASITATPSLMPSDPMMTTSSSTTTTNSATTTTATIAAPRKSGLNNFFGASASRSKSETTMSSSTKSIITPEKPRTTSRSSLLFGTGSLFGSKKKPATEEEKELKDAGVTVKEIKGTLGRLVVPQEIANPMPKVKLEAPQHARLNR